ncbi:MAG: acyl-CoA reductase [Candidatus Binatia bacterium]
MSPRAFHLPAAPARVARARFGEAELETAVLEASDVGELVGRLALPAGDARTRAAAVARAARRFGDPADPLRRLAEEWLPPTTGFSRAMIAETVPGIFAPLEAEALARAVGAARGFFVASLAIVTAGNVPGVAVAKTALALTAGVPSLVKTASGEPLLSVLFAQAVAEADARLGESHAALWWEGARGDLASTLGASVASLVAYGSDEAIAALRTIAPPLFVAHGHRSSVAAVRLDGGAEPSAIAAAVARDVALYDQQGCLSPQALFAIGGSEAALGALVEELARSLADLATRLPRGRMSDGEHVTIRRFRDAAEWRVIRGEGVILRHDPGGTAWTLLVDPTPALRANPLGRTLVVHPIGSAAELAGAVGGHPGRIESLGIAPWPDDELAVLATELGIPRVVRVGEMQTPGLDWRQGGLDPLAGIVAAEEARAP